MAATVDPAGASPAIEGYATATSVPAGGKISFQVSTRPAARYRVEISRLGWYGGHGGRRIACLVGTTLDRGCTLDRPGIEQAPASAPDRVTGEISAGWSTTDTLSIPADWTTGYYLAVFRLTSGPSAGQTGFTPFIVQAPADDHAAILVQVPTNTWQAYNPWGGEDFYTAPRAVKVSFDRPFAHRLLFDWEYPLIRFLERGGWDVSYATDDEVSGDPSLLLQHALDMAAGHDEYWTKTMRDAWDAARDAGVNLAFMGANDGYWQVRYEDGGRTLVGYKASPDPDPDPGQKTTQFRELSPARPECELFGVQFQDDVLYHRNLDLVADSAVASDPWFAGSGLSTGSVLPGLGGSETDAVMPGCHVPPVTRLFSTSGPPLPNGTPVRQDTVRYTACSGAEVFSAGSLQFAWGLDDWRDAIYAGPGLPAVPPADLRLQTAMTRALADLVRSHVPSRGFPQICVPSADILTAAHWAAVGQQLSLSAAASDPYGQIASERWTISLPGPSATTDQSSAEGPTITTTAGRSGTARIDLTVADRSGATAKKLLQLQVCPCPWRGWPPPTEQGLPCRLMDIGALRQIGHSLWFVPNSPAADLRLTTYVMGMRGRRIRRTRVGNTTKAHASVAIRIRTVKGPMDVDVSSFVAGHRWHQRFALGPASASTRRSAGLQVATTCDGVSAQVLTPIFGAGGQLPLRVSVSGWGRIVVSLIGPSGATLTRRVVVMRRRRQTVAVAPPRLRSGAYTVTVSAWRSRLPQPIRLTALLLQRGRS